MSEEKQRTIAEELSAARQARGLDLEEVHQQSGISLAVLRGIEDGQFDVVEPVFARLALQAYAEYLGLNPEPFLTRFDQQQGRAFQPRQRAVLLSQPTPKSKHRSHRSQTPLIVIISIIGACCLLVGAYYLLGDKIAPPPQTVSPPPEPEPTTALNDPAPEGGTGGETDQSETEPEPTPAPSDTLLVQPEAAPPPPAAAIQAPVVLELEARDSTWVQIHWDDAEENFEGIVPPGQRHRFEARGHFVVLSTRPHGLQYWLDGQLLGDGQLGDPNKVLRFRATAAGITLLPLTEEAPDAQP